MFTVTATAQSADDPLAGLELTDRPDPDPPPGWEVVEVRAASLNHHDLWSLRGVGLPEDKLPMVLGCDAAGVTADGREVVVHAVVTGRDVPAGSGAPDHSILSEHFDGAFADRVAVPSANLIDKPEGLSFAEAACLPTAYLTAYRMLFTKGECRPGMRLLVQGAGGGVSTAAVLLARAAGLHVTVTSRSGDKLERARELGAHVGVESGARLPRRVDVVAESVGAATWGHSLRSLVRGGRVVVIGSTTGPDPPAELNRIFYRELDVVGSTMGTVQELRRLVTMLEATGTRPLIDDTLPMEQAPEALRRMAEGDVFGKLVLTR